MVIWNHWVLWRLIAEVSFTCPGKSVSSCEYVDAANDVFWYYNYDDNLRGRNSSKIYVTRRELTKNVRVPFMILVKIFRKEVDANIAIHEVADEMEKEFPVNPGSSSFHAAALPLSYG
ncbi:hypothetical protein OUZ56_028639 [Daphnia magna]|uniref:Uncharacterized protein n=1 Tax=Daphnia magna TaxID=35525 RepID=A0ABR0B4G6_9CRUS|nr:hypothetical protein OUZ56_028639 [Daphnia magna]